MKTIVAMRTLLRAVTVLLLFAGSTFAQGIPHNISPVTGPNGQPRPGATISFCQHPANAVPCSNFANAYNDIGLTQLINQSTTPFKTDGLGNVPAFYAAPGIYDYTVSGAGIAAPNGPYVINIAPATNGNNNWTGPNSFSQPITSTVATGTAPFSIASTTVVPNLNAQLHNGLTAPASAIVGVSDTQTLTNKTLTSPTVTNETLDGFGAGHIATNLVGPSNVGTSSGTQTLIASVPANGLFNITFNAVQTTAGVGCSAGANSVSFTSLTYTTPENTVEVSGSTTLLNFTGNGILDGGAGPGSGNTGAFSTTLIAKAGTSITFQITSSLGDTGCTTTPQYTVYTKAFF